MLNPLNPRFYTTLLLVLTGLAGAVTAQADVKLTELEDRVRVEIDGKLFTEYRHKEWYAPYLFPVVGPNGETVTRHFPMEEGVLGEQEDHPHHRSIRFSHSLVNGFNFWAPQSRREEREADIHLEKIEKMESGKTGELVVWNRWMGDGKLVLRERLLLKFTPLEKGEVLVDYDTELHAGEEPVLFGDQKDGGLGVRVAGTMKVADRKTGEGKGAFVTSKGDRNDDAWGTRAEWLDTFGPDKSGKTVGIAIFDHPSNLRFPVWWHARTYGMIAANRFGTGFFDQKEGAKMGDGDYTLPAGEALKLRHRLYIHHGDTEAADVASRYQEYTGAE